MTLYALVPVRIRISSNSAAEIMRVDKIVKDIVGAWQSMVRDDYVDNGPTEGNPLATCPEEQVEWLEPREPLDAITVVEGSGLTPFEQ